MDNTLSSKQKINLMRWTSLIKQREESGLNVTEWCRLNGIDRRTYYYWLEKLRNIAFELTDQELSQAIRQTETLPAMVEIQLTDDPRPAHRTETISLTKKDLHISIPAGIGEDVLLAVLREVLRCS